MRWSAAERQLEILGEACSRLAKLEPKLVGTVTNLLLAIDLRNRIIHGYDDEIVFLTVTDDLDALKFELEQLLAVRGAAGPTDCRLVIIVAPKWQTLLPGDADK